MNSFGNVNHENDREKKIINFAYDLLKGIDINGYKFNSLDQSGKVKFLKKSITLRMCFWEQR